MNPSRSRCFGNEKPDDAVIKEMTGWREDTAGASTFVIIKSKLPPQFIGNPMNPSRSRCFGNEKPYNAVIKEMTGWREDAAGTGKAEST